MSGMMMCTMGVAPSSLMVLPAKMCMTSNMPAATIMDNVPMMNIMPFGMCMSPANPMVAAATAAAMGVLTPMPCIPNTPAPWLVGAPTAMLGNLPVLNNTSTLMCIWAGTISVTFPGEVTEQTP
jgi:hypothetical protein